MTKQEFLTYIKEKAPVILDGATGSNLMAAGMPVGVCPEDWILKNPKALVDLQKAYVAAGTNILYAPTFREDVRYNNIFDYFDVDKFQKELGDEYSLIIRLHPRVFDYDKDNSISNKLSKLDNTIINCTDYENEQDLLLISDMLITDYSSIMIDFGLLRKPIIFYAYDLENYLNNERGFYLDYNKDLPGPIVENMDDLVGIIKDNNYDYDRLDKFLNYEFDYLDSNSSKRIVDYLLKQ